MAEEKTEQATPKRRAEVRKRGQTSRSPDMTTAAVLMAGLYGLKILAGSVQAKLTLLLTGSLAAVGTVDKNADLNPGMSVVGVLGGILPPLLGILAIAAVGASVLQGGFLFVPGLLSPKFDRVNPGAGLKRILSVQGLSQLVKSLAKIGAVGLVVWITLRSHQAELAALGALDLRQATSRLVSLIWEVAFRSALAMLAIGAMDWLWQRRRFLQSIKMTKKEVEEENRQSEGDPHVRAQQKGKRQQFFLKMMQSVKTADVVVTNPTHFAVALKYDPTAMSAPIVVAKGADHLALRIRELAKEAGVPVMENPPLARALYRLVKVNFPIPAELYVAVAEVLAFVFRLKAERKAS
jgi:flagellar biosynthetic protein FlhB